MSSMCTLILVLTAVLMNNYGINDFMVKAIENQGITVTPTGYDDHGQVNRIKISGAEGTAATKKIGDGTPYATIRVYKLQKVENSDRSEYDEVLLPPSVPMKREVLQEIISMTFSPGTNSYSLG